MSELSQSLDRLKGFAEDWFMAETQRRQSEQTLDRQMQMEVFQHLVSESKEKRTQLQRQQEMLRNAYTERGGKLDALSMKDQTYAGKELLDELSNGPFAVVDAIYQDVEDDIQVYESNINELKQANYQADMLDEYISQADPRWGGDPSKIDPEDLDVAFDKMLKESGKVMGAKLTDKDVAALGGPLTQHKTPERLQELQEDYIGRAQTDVAFLEGKEQAVNKSLNVILSPLSSKLETIFQGALIAQKAKRDYKLDDADTKAEDIKIDDSIKAAGKTLFPFIGNDAVRNQMSRNMYAAMLEAQDRGNPNNQGLINYLEVVSTYYTNTVQTNPDMAARVAELITPIVGLDITNIANIETIMEQQRELIQINLDKLNLLAPFSNVEEPEGAARPDLDAFFKSHLKQGEGE